jgi:hypothetical protein
MSTQFSYELSPYGAVVGENFTFTLSMSNPADGTAESNIQIYVQFDNNLTDDISDIHPASVDPNWSCISKQTSSGIIFVIEPNTGATFEPGETKEFKFSNVQINDTLVTADVNIIEKVSGNQNSDTIKVPKLLPKLGIVAYAKPVKIGKGQSTELFFTSNAASVIKIEPIGDVIRTVDQGNGSSYSAKIEVTPPVMDGTRYQFTYTLTASNDAGDYAPIQVTVTTEPPQIDSFTATPTSGVALDDDVAVTFQWTTQYTNVCYIQPQYGDVIQVSNNGNMSFSGNQLRNLLQNSPNQSTMTFIFYADNGHGFRDEKNLTVKLANAQILYFKYRNPDLTDPTYAAANAVATQYTDGGSAAASKYKVDGPGGTLEQYLGKQSSTPQIVYFSPDKTEITAGENITLSWVVYNIDSMVLEPGDVKGSLQVTPKQDKTYVLRASSGVTSTLSITVNPAK